MAPKRTATGLETPATPLLLLGAEVEELLDEPEPEPELPVEVPVAVVSVAVVLLVRVATLKVVLRAMAVPVPAEAAVPPMVVVGMLEFRLAAMELTVLLSEAMTELTEAMELLAAVVVEDEAEDEAEAEPPERENWPE